MAPKLSYVAKHAGDLLFNVLERTQHGAERGYAQEERVIISGIYETLARALAQKLMRSRRVFLCDACREKKYLMPFTPGDSRVFDLCDECRTSWDTRIKARAAAQEVR